MNLNLKQLNSMRLRPNFKRKLFYDSNLINKDNVIKMAELTKLKDTVINIVNDIDTNNDEKVTLTELTDYVADKIKKSRFANLSIYRVCCFICSVNIWNYWFFYSEPD